MRKMLREAGAQAALPDVPIPVAAWEDDDLDDDFDGFW
jgi:hypothetical protein